MQFVFLMKFKLQDATDSLDVFLFKDAVSFYHPWASWRRKNPTKDAAWACYDISVCSCLQELFFGVAAEDAAANQEAQSHVCRIVESICPPEGSTGTFLLNTDTLKQAQATPPQLQKNNLRRHTHAWLSVVTIRSLTYFCVLRWASVAPIVSGVIQQRGRFWPKPNLLSDLPHGHCLIQPRLPGSLPPSLLNVSLIVWISRTFL